MNICRDMSICVYMCHYNRKSIKKYCPQGIEVPNRKDAILSGIPSQAILVTGKANNTFQESEELKKLFQKLL